MKKLVLAVMAMVGVAFGAQAQEKGDFSVGLNANYRMWDNASDANNLGFGAKVRYNLSDPFRLEANFNYTLEKENVKAMDYTVNAHYIFKLGEKFSLYPTVGLGFVNFKWDMPSGGASGADMSEYEDLMNQYGDLMGEYGDMYDEAMAEYEEAEGGSDDSLNEFMWQVGVGAEYPITDAIGVNAEFKYNKAGGDIDDSWFMFNVGVTYTF